MIKRTPLVTDEYRAAGERLRGAYTSIVNEIKTLKKTRRKGVAVYASQGITELANAISELVGSVTYITRKRGRERILSEHTQHELERILGIVVGGAAVAQEDVDFILDLVRHTIEGALTDEEDGPITILQ